jgi:hypothetical protein
LRVYVIFVWVLWFSVSPCEFLSIFSDVLWSSVGFFEFAELLCESREHFQWDSAMSCGLAWISVISNKFQWFLAMRFRSAASFYFREFRSWGSEILPL